MIYSPSFLFSLLSLDPTPFHIHIYTLLSISSSFYTLKKPIFSRLKKFFSIKKKKERNILNWIRYLCFSYIHFSIYFSSYIYIYIYIYDVLNCQGLLLYYFISKHSENKQMRVLLYCSFTCFVFLSTFVSTKDFFY